MPARSVNNFDENAADRDKTVKDSDGPSLPPTAPEEKPVKNKSNASQVQCQGFARKKVLI